MEAVLREQGDDPRVLFLLWKLSDHADVRGLERAALLDYAPAQAKLGSQVAYDDGGAFRFATRSAELGCRDGYFQLARCYLEGRGCVADHGRAVELYGLASELDHVTATFRYGQLRYHEIDWQRYECWLRVATRGYGKWLVGAVLQLLTRFERRCLGRILHTVAPALRQHLDCRRGLVFDVVDVSQRKAARLQRMLVLHAEMLERAKEAILCWSAVGRRCGVVRDVRIMICKAAWQEPWRWGDRREEEAAQDQDE
jgi:hypothetical protein